jgi:hypothetical protein
LSLVLVVWTVLASGCGSLYSWVSLVSYLFSWVFQSHVRHIERRMATSLKWFLTSSHHFIRSPWAAFHFVQYTCICCISCLKVSLSRMSLFSFHMPLLPCVVASSIVTSTAEWSESGHALMLDCAWVVAGMYHRSSRDRSLKSLVLHCSSM